jgi:hypothetical protein
VGKLAFSIIALVSLDALNVRIGYFVGISASVAFVVVKVAACELVRSREGLTIGTNLSLESGKVEPKELISADELGLVFVEHIAVDTKPAAVVIALACFIYQGVIKELE